MDQVIDVLTKHGWVEDGVTIRQSYRTHSFAFGGGPIVHTGGRRRFKKGDWKVTVGKRTVCFFKKPESPSAIAGRGPLAGKKVFTFEDWDQRNFPTKDIAEIEKFLVTLQ